MKFGENINENRFVNFANVKVVDVIYLKKGLRIFYCEIFSL